MRVVSKRAPMPITIEFEQDEALLISRLLGMFARATIAKYLCEDIDSHITIATQKATDELYDCIKDFYDESDE